MPQTQEARLANGFRLRLEGDRTSYQCIIRLVFKDPATGEAAILQEFTGPGPEAMLVYEGMKRHYKRLPQEQTSQVCAQFAEWLGYYPKQLWLPAEGLASAEEAFYFACFSIGRGLEESEARARHAVKVYEEWLEKHPVEAMTPLELLSYTRPGSTFFQVDYSRLEVQDYETLKTLERLYLFGHKTEGVTGLFKDFYPSPAEEKELIGATRPSLEARAVQALLKHSPPYESTYQGFTREQASKFFLLRFADHGPAFVLALEELLENKPEAPKVEFTSKIMPLLKDLSDGQRMAFHFSTLAREQWSPALTIFLNEAVETYEEDEAARSYVNSYLLDPTRLFNVVLPVTSTGQESYFDVRTLDYYVYSLLSKQLSREAILQLGAELNLHRDPLPIQALEAFLASYEEYKAMPVSWWAPLVLSSVSEEAPA